MKLRKTGMKMTQKKVGRNDPCPCGSGKKFKKCCEERLSGKKKFQASVLSSKGKGLEGKATKISKGLFNRPSPDPDPEKGLSDLKSKTGGKAPENDQLM